MFGDENQFDPEAGHHSPRIIRPPVRLADFEVEYAAHRRQPCYTQLSEDDEEDYEDEPNATRGQQTEQQRPVQGAASATRGTVHTPLAPANAAIDAHSTIRALSEHNRILMETVKVLTDRMQSDRTVNSTPRQHLTFTPQTAYPNPPAHPVRHSSTPAFRPQLPAYAPRNVPLMPLSQPPSYRRAAHIPLFQDPLPQAPVHQSAEPSGRDYLTEAMERLNLHAVRNQPHPPPPRQRDARSGHSDEGPYRPVPHRVTHRALRPASPPQSSVHSLSRSASPPRRETTYRGPKPSIPQFTSDDPRQFARLKLALENLLPEDATERFKYQVLVDHLRFEEALLIADSYCNSHRPYSDTMRSLIEHYGQPHKLSLKRIAEVMDEPDVRSGDLKAFRRFALKVRALVGMLDQMEEEGAIELHCGSHVARLLSKLPHDLRSNFRRHTHPRKQPVPTLLDFADWLEFELEVQGTEVNPARADSGDAFRKVKEKRERKSAAYSTTVMEVPSPTSTSPSTAIREDSAWKTPDAVKSYCPYCDSNSHYLNQCSNFKGLTSVQKTAWIKTNYRCWRCGRKHQAAKCRLKVTCQTCKGKHLTALHEINARPHTEGEKPPVVAETSTGTLYLDRPGHSNSVLLKVVKVLLYHGPRTLTTYAILDDGSERTILLQAAAKQLGLVGQPENLSLRTVKNDAQVIAGATVTFTLSPASQPKRKFQIEGAFTAEALGLARHSHPVAKYHHLRDLPLQPLDNVQPLLLIGSDYPHLITPVEPVRLGPPGGPAAIKTRLGWTLQGPTKLLQHRLSPQQCLFTALKSPAVELREHVEKLWQLDILPYTSEKEVVRSRCDQEAVQLLQAKTVRVDVDGILRYATPLLRKQSTPLLRAPPQAVLPMLRGTEKRLSKDPELAKVYNEEIRKLEDAGYVTRLPSDRLNESPESWYIPHHLVSHNGKHRVVFNCSFKYQGGNLNECLLAGPTLGSSLLGVLLRFREHTVAFAGDIKGMFHQIRLLPEDKPLLRFIWRDMVRDAPVTVYQWNVLPFGTTCSPCCATFALQKHVIDHSDPQEEVRNAVEHHFYVDNWLQSCAIVKDAKGLVDRLRVLLEEGGFSLRQWASNDPQVICHLPAADRSASTELWLSHQQSDAKESTLGLQWHCQSDTLTYKCRQMESQAAPTMRIIYRILASQYDPLGYIIPFTTRAKSLVQKLWEKQRDWDDPLLPADILQAWKEWESELKHIDKISIPRCYVTAVLDSPNAWRDIHIFCDASERAYGSVGYLRTEDASGQVQVAFLAARSRVAPKRQQSMPRLELCAALTGAQLATTLGRELTLDVRHVHMWTDSSTVLTWITSDSCRYKVFVGTRIAEIQELTDIHMWRYVPTNANPADDLTRGKTLLQLAELSCWSQGPAFLLEQPDAWPASLQITASSSDDEERKPTFCAHVVAVSNQPDITQFQTFQDLVDATAQGLHGAAGHQGEPPADTYREAEISLYRDAQASTFPEEVKTLSAGKPVPSTSRLLTLSPELDADRLLSVGGHLRRGEGLDQEVTHPVVLDPKHPLTALLIKKYDEDLRHPGVERVFAELRRKYWILRGRETIKRHQHHCTQCQRWRGKPEVPRMADLPPSRLRLFKPAFHSTGVDCFGPFIIRVGRRSEKRWGIIFKCLTTRGVYLDLLNSIDTDSFLMALRRFVSRRGKPYELLSDQGTNFTSGQKELKEAFTALEPDLQSLLAKQQIRFQFNPPGAPHFGGTWEREIRSLKAALQVTLGSQSVTEEVLRTVLTEIEGILTSKPLAYVSSDVADVDPVTPNSLLMGRPDSSLPQIVYPASEMLTRKRWRHSQVLADHFWSHFIRRYLPSLQPRSKWTKETDNLQTGTVVMIVDQRLPRALWPVGVVTHTTAGADGRIRSATVQVKDRDYSRPVSRLVRLAALPEDDQTPLTSCSPQD